jgi:CheY-like chemotaxis protein/anti-sigma regulatory factor (Ser/Thr protein kinase)
MVEDLLDVSAIIRGKLRLHTGPVDLGAVVAAAVESVRLQADEKQIALRTTIDPDAASGHGDPARLQQIVWNLLSNAIKFTPAGGRVAVELRRPDAAHVEIVVRDSGRGIDPAFLPHVFDRFRQGDATPTRVHGGLGLGLSIVRHLVEAHGGAVRAESDGLDKGAAFIVTLPVAPVRAAAAEPAVPVVADLLDGVGVLLVEIGAAAAEDIAADLTRRGARLTRVDSVAVALQVIERERPALIVAAIPHPERDGHELIEAVRRLPGSRRIPALAITPVASVTHHHAALAAGFDRHLSRPVDPAELAAIAAALARA